MKKYILIIFITIIITFITIYYNIKVTNINNNLITINVLGFEFNYYFESEG